MNIFILDLDVTRSAQFHMNRHVCSSLKEMAQMMCTNLTVHLGVRTPYKPTHINHPCTRWLMRSKLNWAYGLELAKALHSEWRFRFNHSEEEFHKSYEVLMDLPFPSISSVALTPFVLATNGYTVARDPVESYRKYYIEEKQHLADWGKRGIPDWWKERM